MDELKWNWVYVPYLDAPDKQKESAIKAGYAKVYFKFEVDAVIAELKDKYQMHDFFWEGCGFAKRGFKNTIAVSEAFDKLEAENAELKKKCEIEKSIGATYSETGAELARWVEELRNEIESLKASHYAEMVDAGMRERRLRRALWLARALRAIDIQRWWISATCAKITERACRIWYNVERKCRAKAEQYK